jgi:outer membrane protein OmpA-like peptidoglycan-associated protein
VAARTFLVFFDWSKADLTDRARQIIGEAASARGAGVTRIEVNGFTDRSGPADYNMQLSIRRANAVAAELVRRGVPRNEIVTRGFGEENNLVPTADGVREPQNRRVEIILK